MSFSSSRSNLFYHTLTLSGLASTANQVFIFCGILHLDDFSPIRLTDLSQLILAGRFSPFCLVSVHVACTLAAHLLA